MPEIIQTAAEPSVSAYLGRPSGAVHGGVVVIHEVWGLTEHIKSVADRLAAEGYLALAPDLLAGTGVQTSALAELETALFDPERRSEAQPKLRALMAPIHTPDYADQTNQRLLSCFNELYANGETNQKVAVIGFCFGGSYSFNLAVNEPRLKLSLPFYGHADQPTSELSQIKCPVYAFYGEKDERLMEGLPDLTSRMIKANVSFEATVYPDCGHAFFNDTNPFAYNQLAATKAWQRVKELLSSQLA